MSREQARGSDLDTAGPATGAPPILSVRDLEFTYGRGSSATTAVRGVSFDVRPGETLGIVGESGSGKSTTVLGLLGLLEPVGRVTGGSVDFDGHDFLGLGEAARRRLLGEHIGVVYQDALRALNPVVRVGTQITEALKAHGKGDGAQQRAVELLGDVGVSEPARRVRQYPHEFSGGMRQRAMVAIGLSMAPGLLVVDEPTTALDVTIQAQVLELIKRLAEASNTATLLVTHDLGVIAGMSDRVLVMYAGQVVEQGPTEELFEDPRHPYTRMLLRSMPSISSAREHRLPYIPGRPPAPDEIGAGCAFAARCYAAEPRCSEGVPELLELASGHLSACFVAQDAPDGIPPPPPPPTVTSELRLTEALGESLAANDVEDDHQVLFRMDGVTRRYGGGRRLLRDEEPAITAVDGLDLTVRRGESIGLVGESGCGKSTLGRLIVGLEQPDEGSYVFAGQDVSALSKPELRAFRRRAQMIYQDPRSSLNRRMTVGELLAEPLAIRGVPRGERPGRAAELLELVGLRPNHLRSYPGEFSGGQAQRIAVARALAVEPELLVADEAVSALDVSVQGQVLNLLRDVQEELGLTVVFIAHDLAVVRQVCDRVAVMYLGRIVELGAADDLFARPEHPYTAALRSAHPEADPEHERARQRILLPGEAPSPSAVPPGCRFHPRCPIGPTAHPERTICREQEPVFDDRGARRHVACHFPGELQGG